MRQGRLGLTMAGRLSPPNLGGLAQHCGDQLRLSLSPPGGHTISGCCVVSRAVRPALKGRKGSPQRRSDEDGAGNALSLSQRLRRPRDGREGVPPLFSWRKCDGPAGTARATRLTCQGQPMVQALASPPFTWSRLLLNCQWGRRAAHVVRLDSKKYNKKKLHRHLRLSHGILRCLTIPKGLQGRPSAVRQ